MSLDVRLDLHDRWQAMPPAAVRALDALVAGWFTAQVEMTREQYARLMDEAEAASK